MAMKDCRYDPVELYALRQEHNPLEDICGLPLQISVSKKTDLIKEIPARSTAHM